MKTLQNLAIFVLAALYFRRLRLPDHLSIVGLCLLATATVHSLWQADLALNSYNDLMFYLIGALLILSGRTFAIVPLMIVATLNRETCGLIPIMLICHRFRPGSTPPIDSRVLTATVSGLAVWLVIYLSIRWCYGDHPFYTSGDPNRLPLTLNLLGYNILRERTYIQLLTTMTLLPILALCSYRTWARELKSFFWAIVPAWMVIHVTCAIIAETRLLLVPLVLVFIPGTLAGILYLIGQDRAAASRQDSGKCQQPHGEAIPDSAPVAESSELKEKLTDLGNGKQSVWMCRAIHRLRKDAGLPED